MARRGVTLVEADILGEGGERWDNLVTGSDVLLPFVAQERTP